MDELYTEAVADNARFLEALTTGIGPKAFRWSRGLGGYIPQSYCQAEMSQAKYAEADTLRVDRDSCSYCGVRADVGCRHRR